MLIYKRSKGTEFGKRKRSVLQRMMDVNEMEILQ